MDLNWFWIILLTFVLPALATGFTAALVTTVVEGGGPAEFSEFRWQKLYLILVCVMIIVFSLLELASNL